MKPLHAYFDSAFQIPQLDGLSDDQESDDENRSLMEWKRVRKKKASKRRKVKPKKQSRRRRSRGIFSRENGR